MFFLNFINFFGFEQSMLTRAGTKNVFEDSNSNKREEECLAYWLAQ